MSEDRTASELAVVEAEVEELKRYLLAPADAKFPFEPTLWKLGQRTDLLHFRKLSYHELLEHQDELVQIPPRFTTRPWTKQEWEDLPEEMKEWWRQPRRPTKEEATMMREASCSILTLTNMDGKSLDEFKSYDASVVNECFQFVAKVSGFSDDALELLDWFRQQQ
jgi:hypothetical protein